MDQPSRRSRRSRTASLGRQRRTPFRRCNDGSIAGEDGVRANHRSDERFVIARQDREARPSAWAAGEFVAAQGLARGQSAAAARQRREARRRVSSGGQDTSMTSGVIARRQRSAPARSRRRTAARVVMDHDGERLVQVARRKKDATCEPRGQRSGNLGLPTKPGTCCGRIPANVSDVAARQMVSGRVRGRRAGRPQ